ncbi:hypothetical protein ACERK3_00385 [Phycisphaerales bacterium AB-hyl4]|uniref:Spy/CpxP family protein refolding chaperone n=1 Tax=Natronomicrosphaera hydrolytica TaxID=3242702 RepID=A0ABV4U047_9BACT
MKQLSSKIVPVMLVLAMMAGGAMLVAQDRGERGDRGDRAGGDRAGERRQVDGERMRERMANRQEAMRERLGVTEEEWEALEPMVEEVRSLQAQGGRGGMMMGRRGGMRGGGGPGWGGGEGRGDRELSPVQQASRDLGQTLRDDNASEADIQEKLEALRSAREDHQRQLEEAREELRGVLTPRQEAQFVIMGILE